MKTIVTLTVTRYPAWAVPFAFHSMLFFRLPLLFRKDLIFWRLMGSGKNGTFDKTPDLRQWGMLCIFPEGYFPKNAEKINAHDEILEKAYGKFIKGWIKIFKGKSTTFLLEPMAGHGVWNGREVFGQLPKNVEHDGEMAVMTRATIRFSKLSRFWSHVPDAAEEMAKAEGFITSYGLGEWPWIKQATFSIWKNQEFMKSFAYKSHFHKEIIRKTRQENWYSEDMFVRFRVLRKF
ncbi:MAG: spheroidene monooxygenase [Chitinophagaceae bacterium]|nr:spheroidene monooxygenase [Chitinophagaceae bacterium]